MRIEQRKQQSPSFCMNDKMLRSVRKLGPKVINNFIEAVPKVRTISNDVDFTFFSVTKGLKDREKEMWCVTTPRNILEMNNPITRLFYSLRNESYKTPRTKETLGVPGIYMLAEESKKGLADIKANKVKDKLKEEMKIIKETLLGEPADRPSALGNLKKAASARLKKISAILTKRLKNQDMI